MFTTIYSPAPAASMENGSRWYTHMRYGSTDLGDCTRSFPQHTPAYTGCAPHKTKPGG